MDTDNGAVKTWGGGEEWRRSMGEKEGYIYNAFNNKDIFNK